MKPNLFILAFLLLATVSCSTYRTTIDKISDNHNLISPSISLVTSVIFEKTITDEDQKVKALILENLSSKLFALNFDKKPSRQEFETLLLDNLPLKTHWIILTSTLGSYYEKSTINLADSDVKITLEILREIATGIHLAIGKYID